MKTPGLILFGLLVLLLFIAIVVLGIGP